MYIYIYDYMYFCHFLLSLPQPSWWALLVPKLPRLPDEPHRKTLVARFMNQPSTLFLQKTWIHMIHRTQLYIYVVCSLYMVLYNIHLPIIYMYMTCISNILLVYHLTNRLPSRSLWQHLQQIVWQGLIGHHLYTFLHCRGLYHFCRKPILEAD